MKNLVFDKTFFWVQVHDLLVGDMNLDAVDEIGKVCGEVQ